MLLKRTIHKTKKLVQKALQNIKSYIFGGYQKLSRAPSLNLFSSTNNLKLQQLDNFYKDFCEQWESDRNEATTPRKNKSTISVKGAIREENASNESAINLEPRVLKNKEEKRGAAEHKTASFQRRNGGGGHGLAQKMKEMEMMDVHDVDHVLDVEEVLHYYSRLKSPVYQDLVDKFFMDMYSDFSIPQSSGSTNNSMRRLGPLKI